MTRCSCLCGSIVFNINGSIGKADACHCVQCRKWTGHFLPSVELPRTALKIKDDSQLKWYQSSAKVRRGFCHQCGSSLFFDPIDQQKHSWTAVALGAFDTPSVQQLEMHIFVAEKGDYYQLNDGLPQNQR